MQQALTSMPAKTLKQKLQLVSPVVFVLYVSFSSFMVYTCMYGFRKPFTAALYESLELWGVSYKTILVIAQVLGYMLSKFYGIRFIGSMKPEKRGVTIIRLIFVAWLSLLLFSLVPYPFNFVFMFINGLPLGMIWGLVFGFVEGRKLTELMGSVLATSFIFASGLAKTVGKWVMLQYHISEWQMPFIAGTVFIVPLCISVWLLQQTPPPTDKDVEVRTIRLPMDSGERKQFIKQFGLFLTPVITAYAMLTLLRDFCEDFANELWKETGFQNNAAIFTQTSTIISLIVLAIVGGFFLIRNNYKAFQLAHVTILAGFVLALVTTFLYQAHFINPFVWVLSATSGLYLGYVPYNCLYFERMLAAFKIRGNVGFVMYIADAFGYLGTVFVLLLKEFIKVHYSWVSFFSFLFYATSVIGIVLVLLGTFMASSLHKKFNQLV